MTKTVEYTHRYTPSSTALKDVFYDQANNELYVQFHNGRIAGYQKVALTVFESFRNAHSAGRFYNDWVLNRYSGTSGDVTFRPKAEPETVMTTDNYTVYYTLTGKVTLAASSVQEAVDKVKKAAGEQEGAEITVRKVEVDFE